MRSALPISLVALLFAALPALSLIAAGSAAPDWRARNMAKLMRRAYKDYVGYNELAEELGDRLPDGSGIRVMQVEAGKPEDEEDGGWSPDPELDFLAGKHFIYPGLTAKHASDVSFRFYSSESMAPGVKEIECLPNVVWGLAKTGMLRSGTRVLPQVSSCRVANHSWVATPKGWPDTEGLPAQSDDPGERMRLEVLKRIDYLVDTDDFIQVGGANNKQTVPDVIQSCYNAICVGKTDARHSLGTNALDDPLYCDGRTKPDLVAPDKATSLASPMVAAAVVVLLDFAQQQGNKISNAGYTSPRTQRLVWHAETSEVIKAALMAGADRTTHNGLQLLGNISDYREEVENRTANGLDRRYGAGQLNLRNSLYLLATGEQDSLEDGGEGNGSVDVMGFDYDPEFGGTDGSNRQATYRLPEVTEPIYLKASLVWNIQVNAGRTEWDGEAVLHDLDLMLCDADLPKATPMARSASFHDNSENLWCGLRPGRRYMLRIEPAKSEPDFCQDYAIAWQLGRVPESGIDID